MRRVILGWLCMLALGPAGRAQIVLTDLQGRKATVEITGASPAEIGALLDGRPIRIKLDQLSQESAAAAIDYAKQKGVYSSFPPLNVQIKIGYQHRGVNGYQKDVTLNPSIILEGVQKMAAIPAAEASLVIVTHDTRQKYAYHNDKMKVYAAQTIQIPPGMGGRREIPFSDVRMRFDTARDPSNIGGNEYQYFLFGLRDPETKQLIDFQTNSAKIMAYIAKHPEEREKLLAASKGSDFTDDLPAK